MTAPSTYPVHDLPQLLVDPNHHNIQADFSSQGFVLFVPHPRFIIRNVLRAIWRARNRVVSAFYPVPLSLVIGLNAAAVYRAMTVPGGWSLITSVMQRWPLLTVLPERLRVPWVAFHTSAAVLFGVTSLQRFVLRRLLSYTGWVNETRGPKSAKTLVWGAILKYFYMREGGKALMLNFQNCLPTLPLPKLDTTIARYLESVKPLMSPAEYDATVDLAQQFLAKEGPTLQRYLTLKSLYSTNYITDWWVDIAYLRGRDNIAINSNYFCIARLRPPPTSRQASRAAVMIQLFVRAKLEIDHERLSPMLMQGVIPLCMDQYLRVFSTVREPHQTQDKLVSYDSLASRHVIVLHRGRIFVVDCFSQRSRRPLTARQLETTLQGILDDTSEAGSLEGAIPVLTSLNRDRWAEVRSTCFEQVPGNNKSLEMIERALFVVSLDEFEPRTLQEEGLNYFIGNAGQNRWVDKSFHLIITKNAKIGIEAEHSWGDAPTLGHIFEQALARECSDDPYNPDGTVKRVERDLKKEAAGKAKVYPAVRLRFHVTPALGEILREAIPMVAAECADVDYDVVFFESYGRKFMKAAKCGPDAYVQMALQLAYYRDQGKFDHTYESSMTRLYKEGRTDTIRSVSAESCAWVRAMQDPAVAVEDKVKLLHAAVAAHSKYSSRALVGAAIDRHLFALYVVAAGAQIPSPLLREAMQTKWRLSTSQVLQRYTLPKSGAWPGNDQGDLYPLPSGGFGAVAKDGYGVCYCFVGDYRVALHVTSFKSAENTETKRFAAAIRSALTDMRALFHSVPDMGLPEELRVAWA
eukprot:PhM_4_TR17059/c0_g1_i1/m.90367/K08765/CPT1A; carnitine O-palmitoyltransferase 1, liver isoform